MTSFAVIAFVLASVSDASSGCSAIIASDSILQSFGNAGLVGNCATLTSSAVDASSQFCFTSSSSSSSGVAYAAFVLSQPFVITGVSVSPIGSLSSPSTLKLDQQGSDQAFDWFLTSQDESSGLSWSLVASNTSLGGDFSGNYIRVYPVVASQQANQPLSMAVSLQGCPVASTSLIAFQFGSSEAAVRSRFASVGNFLGELQSHICRLMGLGVTGCSQVIPSNFQEGSGPASPASASSTTKTSLPSSKLGFSASSAVPYITVTYRILPAGAGCVGCANPKALTEGLQQSLTDPSSEASSVLSAISDWIQDDSAYLCAGKTCGDGELCIAGVCVSAESGIGGFGAVYASGAAVGENIVLSELAMDAEVESAAPLPVILSAPNSPDSLIFTVKTTKSSETSSSNSTGMMSWVKSIFKMEYLYMILAVIGICLLLGGVYFWVLTSNVGISREVTREQS